MRKVTIIGAGPGNPDLLSRAALDAIDIADVVIGAHRALVGIDVPPDVVVMTGDVGLFSGARRLMEALRRRAGGRARHSRHKLSVVSRRAPRASMAGLALRERSRRGVRHRGRGRARR